MDERYDDERAMQAIPTRVLVVEGTWWWREAFLRILERCPDGFEVTSLADLDAVRRALEGSAPDVAVIDLDQPDGAEILGELRRRGDVPCLAMASELSSRTLGVALTAAASFAVKQELDPERLCRLVTILRAGDTMLLGNTNPILGDLVRHGFQTPSLKYGLTAREAEVVALLADGLSNAEIAAELHVTGGHVKKLVSRALHRLGVRNRTEAALLARREGIVRPRM